MNRFKEPSTWAGLAAILQAMKLFFPAHAVAVDGLTAIAGGVAMVVRERGAVAQNVGD
jgi:hypothetical protein